MEGTCAAGGKKGLKRDALRPTTGPDNPPMQWTEPAGKFLVGGQKRGRI
jgi:hypothetical protein